jgi:hypothetical protein
MYKIVQTIGNKIAGGANGGLFRLEKVCIEFLVSNPAKMPVKRGIAIEKSSFFRFSMERIYFKFIQSSL